jgi:hypothetical protein
MLIWFGVLEKRKRGSAGRKEMNGEMEAEIAQMFCLFQKSLVQVKWKTLAISKSQLDPNYIMDGIGKIHSFFDNLFSIFSEESDFSKNFRVICRAILDFIKNLGQPKDSLVPHTLD